MLNQTIAESDLDQLLGKTFLKSVRYFSQIESTNTKCISLLAAEENLPTPCLVYAESQTAGRGRGANRWWSQAGSLTFSVIVDASKFSLTPEQMIKLPLLTGLAVLQTCRSSVRNIASESAESGDDFSLKWPNDVYLSGRKLAGILIEVPSANSASPTDVTAHHAVIGVGLNVNNSCVQAPEDLEMSGISLFDKTDSIFDRMELLMTFLIHLERLIQSLSQGLPVLNQWSDHCLLTGKYVTLLIGNKEVSGECLGLAANGALKLKTDQKTQQFLGGVVKSWE